MTKQEEVVKTGSWQLTGWGVLVALIITLYFAFPSTPTKESGHVPGDCTKNSRNSANTTSFLVI